MKGKLTALMLAGLAAGSNATHIKTDTLDNFKIFEAINKVKHTAQDDDDEYCTIEYSTETYLHDSGKEVVSAKSSSKKPVVVKPEASSTKYSEVSVIKPITPHVVKPTEKPSYGYGPEVISAQSQDIYGAEEPSYKSEVKKPVHHTPKPAEPSYKEPSYKSALTKEESIVYIPVESYKEASACLLYTSPSPRDQRGSRMPSSA